MNYTDPTGHKAYSDMSPTEKAMACVNGTLSAAKRADSAAKRLGYVQKKEAEAAMISHDVCYGTNDCISYVFAPFDNFFSDVPGDLPSGEYSNLDDGNWNSNWNNQITYDEQLELATVFFGRMPFFYNMPRFLRGPMKHIPQRFRFSPKGPGEIPKFEPTRAPTPEELGAPPDDLWWQQDPTKGFLKEKPNYNPNNPPKKIMPGPIEFSPRGEPLVA